MTADLQASLAEGHPVTTKAKAEEGSRRIVVGPFNRVEGDLEVSLDIAHGKVAAAYVNAPLYRGFENILNGRPALDALVIVPRICGICSVSQSAAAVAALAELSGIKAPANGIRAANLILASEIVADHLTHFYLFFMPDFARDDYRGEPWFATARTRFKAIHGSASAEFLPARARWLTLLGHLAGKWPHTLALRPGGTTRVIEASEKMRLVALIAEFRSFLERVFFGDRLEVVLGLDSLAALERWCGGRTADWPLFIQWALSLGLDAIGRATDTFLSVGAFDTGDGPLFAAGVYAGEVRPFDPAAVREDLARAWFDGPIEALPPAAGQTRPNADKAGAYTWCKAPRYAGQVVETGALARQQVAGHPLLRELVAERGGSVLARVLARGLEVARLIVEMERWTRAIEAGAPFHAAGELPDDGRGAGFVEAARGSLGHWVGLAHGRIAHYQIVAPTTWNFSPRDAAGVPGALETALVGLPVPEQGALPALIQHVVRSFDPCMVCTVH